ncbi:hypothetical protein [Flavobacterium sp.]|uniref:hypothetical protein n=1 Tax=Flavobacterium sp. TaxID=239 RepID=UPI003A8EFBA1
MNEFRKILEQIMSEINSSNRLEKMDELIVVMYDFNKSISRDEIIKVVYEYIADNEDCLTFYQDETMVDITNRLGGFCSRFNYIYLE